MQLFSMSKVTRLAALSLVSLLMVFASPAFAIKMKAQNLSQLVTDSESIIMGKVISVTDGFTGKNLPYTEVTIRVGSDAKGKLEDESLYTFRQFGLLKPRSMGNGKVFVGVTPEGFARWTVGEEVVAFMFKPASMTGLQTTAGLGQGKFVVSNGKVSNQFDNYGLFDEMDTSNFTQEEQNLLTSPAELDHAAFVGLVGKLAGVQN